MEFGIKKEGFTNLSGEENQTDVVVDATKSLIQEQNKSNWFARAQFVWDLSTLRRI